MLFITDKEYFGSDWDLIKEKGEIYIGLVFSNIKKDTQV